MSDFSMLERSASYLTAQLTQPRSPLASAPRPFITLSRESGVGGSALAQALADRLSSQDTDLPWTVYNGNLVDEMLRTNNLPANLTRFLPEDRLHEIDASVGELVGAHPSLWDLIEKANELIRHLAQTGHSIFVGRGANFATADLPYGVHVRIVASTTHRMRCVANRYSLPGEDALRHNAMCDAARRRYVRSTFDADSADPTAYHLVLNAERLSLEAMVDLVVNVIETQRPRQNLVERTPSLAVQLVPTEHN